MILVTGGIYREVSFEGDWDEFYGSGLRAAATLVSMGAPARLLGYAKKTDEPAVRATSLALGVDVETRDSSYRITFQYEHPLAIPFVVPPLHLLVPCVPLTAKADKVLRFGMVEGDAVVTCKHAVYDPQSAYKPGFFRANGSSAERLGIVCNRREASLLTGTDNLEEAAKLIADRDRAAVVVIKQGANGSTVFADGSPRQVPAFQTSRVWPIGSGDVFSAVFAQSWMTDGLNPHDAAHRASLATAWYCDSRSLPTQSVLKEFAPPARTAGIRVRERPTVYLAGPFFNMMQRWMIRQSRIALIDAGLHVFSPLHDVGYGVAQDVASRDLEGIEKSAAIFAICDGLDSGTLFEIGYARKLGRPVVVFVQNESDESLKMLQGSGCEILHDFATAVYRTSWIVNG